MDGVTLTSNAIIYNPKGDIYRGMKNTDFGYSGFGEAYFSTITRDCVKGWKKHSAMTLNLIVPEGKIQIVVYNGADFFTTILSTQNFQRLTVRPNLWFAFKGLSQRNIMLNVASHVHDPSESETLSLSDIDYNGWQLCE